MMYTEATVSSGAPILKSAGRPTGAPCLRADSCCGAILPARNHSSISRLLSLSPERTYWRWVQWACFPVQLCTICSLAPGHTFHLSPSQERQRCCCLLSGIRHSHAVVLWKQRHSPCKWTKWPQLPHGRALKRGDYILCHGFANIIQILTGKYMCFSNFLDSLLIVVVWKKNGPQGE